MFTKLVVNVARVMSSPPHQPMPSAATIAPGSDECATDEATNPNGMNHNAVSANPRKVATAAERPERTYRG